MKHKTIMNLLLASSMLFVFSGTVHAGDAAAAQEKASMCEGCHGIAGGYKTAFQWFIAYQKLADNMKNI